MTVVKSGADTTTLIVDPTSRAARETLYDTAGNVLTKADKTASGITPGTTHGLPILGAERATPRLVRAMTDGSLADGRPTLLFHDPIDGTTINPWNWTAVLTTMTQAQTAALGIQFNSGSSAATTVGAALVSNRTMYAPQRGRLIFRSRQRHTAHFANNLIETGLINAATFSATTTLQAQAATGAVWQKDGSGQYIPTLFYGGTIQIGDPIDNATIVAAIPTTAYATFEIELDVTGAWFRIISQAGVLVAEQRVDLPATNPEFPVSRLNAYTRTYNSAGTGTAVQVFQGDTSVWMLDVFGNQPWSQQLAAAGYSHISHPQTGVTTANYTYGAAPTTRTVAGTSAQEATLGGHVSWNNAGTSFGASDTTDLVLFGYQCPLPHNFVLTGCRISTVNLGAANGATPYTIEYGIYFNSTTAAANGTNSRMFPLGVQTLAASAAIGVPFDRDTIWTPVTPVTVWTTRFFGLYARVLAGTATPSQVIRTIWTPDGYWI